MVVAVVSVRVMVRVRVTVDGSWAMWNATARHIWCGGGGLGLG